MKRNRALACLFGVLVSVSTVAAPQAASADVCRYDRQDLPVPADFGHISTEGSSGDDSRIAGLAADQRGYGHGLLWVNGALQRMPASDWDHVIPQDVNNTGVVAGYQRNDRGVGLRFQAFRYENGAYEFLQTDLNTQSKAIAVNDAGDVLGLVWAGTSENFSGEVVMWPRNGARKTVGSGTPIGINAQRKVVIQGRFETTVIDADSGATTELPGETAWVKFDNDQVLRGEIIADGYRITHWNLDGVQVATYADGAVPLGANSSGMVFGTYRGANGAETPAVWRVSGRTDVVVDQAPFSSVHADITDQDMLIGTYSDTNGIARPARWVWSCRWQLA